MGRQDFYDDAVDRLDHMPLQLRREDTPLCDALRTNACRIVSTFPHARLDCVTVMRTTRIGLNSNLDAEGRNRHV